ncbi:MAG TPA: hypothetical protein VMB81_01585 [Candidatus Sulfotelmatobacter sp.]|nr:hypothetical protein [Candidatus Sulfotelmatobacter sp.]
MTRAAALVAMVGGLAGACTATGVDDQWYSIGYNLGDLAYAADHRDLRVEVHGTPAGVPPGRFATAVAAAMPHGIGIVTHFTPTPDTSANPLYRVVWDYAPNRPYWELCTTGPEAPAAAPIGATKVAVAFCRGPSVLSYVHGAAPGAADPGDPAFEALVRAMTLELFPRHDSVHNRN